MLKPFKFVVQAVLLEHDDGGVIIGEHAAEPVALYGVDALRAWTDRFPDELARLNADRGAGEPG
jgi:hypothetical protein